MGDTTSLDSGKVNNAKIDICIDDARTIDDHEPERVENKIDNVIREK